MPTNKSQVPIGLLSSLCAIFPFFAAAVLVYGWPFAPDFDLYLHLKSGELINALGHPLTRDVFTYTAQGKPDEVHSWLAQWIFWLVFSTRGETGLRWLNFVLLAATLALVGSYVWRRTRSTGACALGISLALLVHHSVQVIRPLLFGELLAVYLLVSILREAQPLSSKKWAAFVITVILWANLHGSALLAIPTSAIYAVAVFFGHNHRHRWHRDEILSVCVPLIAAVLVLFSPSGYRLYQIAWELGSLGRDSGIAEWQSGSPVNLIGSAFGPSRLWIGFEPRNLLILVGTPFMLWYVAHDNGKDKRQVRYHFAQTVFAIVMGVVSYRHTAFLIFAAAFFAETVFFLLARAQPLYSFKRERALGFTGLLLLALFRFYGSGYCLPSIEKSANFLKESELRGNLLNFPGWGSYLIYRHYPDLKVAFDRRLWLHRDYYRREQTQTGQFGGIVLSELGDTYPASDLAIFHSDIPLAKLLGEENWLLVFKNNQASIVLNRNSSNAENLVRVMAYYRSRGIPFDPQRGFDLRAAFQAAPDWVLSHQETVPWGKWPSADVKQNWEREQKQFFEKNDMSFYQGALR